MAPIRAATWLRSRIEGAYSGKLLNTRWRCPVRISTSYSLSISRYDPGFPDTDLVKPSDDKTVIVNVWDWDEDWTVKGNP